MSTSYLQLDNDGITPQGGERVKQLQALFDSLVRQYQFDGGIYIVSLSKQVNVRDSLLYKPVSQKRSHQRHNFLFSNSSMRRLRHEFASSCIEVEPNMRAYLDNDSVIFSYEGDDEACRHCRTILDKYGVRSRFFFRYRDPEYSEFTAEFFLMSDRHPDELSQAVSTFKQELIERLENFHKVLFASRIVPDINPLVGLGLVNDKGRQVLQLVADGHARSEIASMLFLTERGVDYHLNKLKVLFNAKNNAQLVAYAYKYKVLA